MQNEICGSISFLLIGLTSCKCSTVDEKMSGKRYLLFIFSAIFFLGTIFLPLNADPVEDKQALLDFIHNIHHSRSLNWNENNSVCNSWTGVTCDKDQSRVVSLRLRGMALRGEIPTNTISRLSALQNLSLRSNRISGSFPSDFSKLQNLTTLCLQFNNFSGSLPSDFSVWKNLTLIDLSNNYFTGSIPSSISTLTHLTALSLANNSLSGDIPDLNIASLQQINLANNNLTGIVPRSLQRFPSWAFDGNNLSSETVLSPAIPIQPPNGQAQPSKRKTSKLSQSALVGIIVGGCVLGFVVIALLIIRRYSDKGDKDMIPMKSQKKEKSLKQGVSESHGKNSKLVFFEGCNLAFDLEDLLRASAEVLGKGTFGTTYKAALEDATTVVVKRVKEVNVGKREFEQHMEVVGSIRHENVAPLRAYYYSKDEKLMVYDYYEQGSVSAMLHGGRGEGRIPLDWETRIGITIGVARGIAHIHTQNGGKFAHGDIKASNVFLNSEGLAHISDIGLASLISPMPLPVMRAAGYRAPEVTDARKPTQASDVYSFGVLLLELLTGKSPMLATGGDEVVHLVRWVNSVVREEWTAEVFDEELLRYPNIEEQMVEMLQIGMSCVVRMPERRPKMVDVVKMVEDIRRVSTENPASIENKSEISSSTTTPKATEIESSATAN